MIANILVVGLALALPLLPQKEGFNPTAYIRLFALIVTGGGRDAAAALARARRGRAVSPPCLSPTLPDEELRRCEDELEYGLAEYDREETHE
ncbi:MAG: hypothetical protein M1401_01540 [Chloroflexi bacterium]|nr:hypothetical protein [Chloroflexota bacterium]MCL5107560.1 hypothetical protein [Chloroflexota bacterium]